MSAKSNAWKSAILRLYFLNENVAGVGDATGLRGSSAAGTVTIAAHTADPGDGGTMATNEISYTGYARPTVARSSAQWSEASGTVTNSNAISLGTYTAGAGGTITHISIGRSDGTIDYIIALSSSVVVGAGNPTPSIAAGDLDLSEA
jgi:hypothetical protein